MYYSTYDFNWFYINVIHLNREQQNNKKNYKKIVS